MPSFCVVSNCEYKYEHSKNVSFHKFPHHSKELLAKWIEFTGRGADWKPSRWSAICSRHFLPNDFRPPISTSARRCLRREAIPSITIKNFGVNLLDLKQQQHNIIINGQREQDPEAENDGYGKDIQIESFKLQNSSCRLCGFCKAVATFFTNYEIFGMIQKCFPSLNIQLDDKLPKDLCSKCLNNLYTFSTFIDNVMETQRKFEERFTTIKNTSNPLITSEKSLKIKQEPTIKIKQEINEGMQNSQEKEDYEMGVDDDQQQQLIDQKSQLSQLPTFINSQEIINNCDIMEIISLDDAYIDIPDDEVAGNEEITGNAEITTSVAAAATVEYKVAFEQSTIYPVDEHNYCKHLEEMEDVNVKDCKIVKQEKIDSPAGSAIVSVLQPPQPQKQQPMELKKLNKDIIVINESIVKPVPAYDLYHCDYCPMQFLTEETLSEHKKLNHEFRENVCPICRTEFKTFYGFLKHKIIQHSKKMKFFKKRIEIHVCSMCKQKFPTKVAFNNHKKYICKYPEKKFYECKYCNKKLEKWNLLRKHEKDCREEGKKQRITPSEDEIRNEVGKYTCSLCNRTYRSRRNLVKHENSHRPPDQWNYKCGDCEKVFDFCYDLRSHLKNRQCRAAPTDGQHVYFVCVTCGNKFKSLTKLKCHNLIHTGHKPFVCEECGKAFRSCNNLYQHRITHTNIRRHKCDLCDKTFKRRGGLNQHKRAFHFRLKPHECPVCKRRYALKGDMVRCKHSALKDKSLRKI